MVLVSTAITYPHPRHTRTSARRQSDERRRLRSALARPVRGAALRVRERLGSLADPAGRRRGPGAERDRQRQRRGRLAVDLGNRGRANRLWQQQACAEQNPDDQQGRDSKACAQRHGLARLKAVTKPAHRLDQTPTPTGADHRPGAQRSTPRTAEAASALFQVVSQRHLTTSIIITSNRGVGAWGEILGDNTVAAALLDRLLHRSVVLNLDGDSYRLREHHARNENLRATTTGTRQPLR